MGNPMAQIHLVFIICTVFLMSSCRGDLDCKCNFKKDPSADTEQRFTTDESNCFIGLVDQLDDEINDLFNEPLNEDAAELVFDCEE